MACALIVNVKALELRWAREVLLSTLAARPCPLADPDYYDASFGDPTPTGPCVACGEREGSNEDPNYAGLCVQCSWRTWGKSVGAAEFFELDDCELDSQPFTPRGLTELAEVEVGPPLRFSSAPGDFDDREDGDG